MDFVGLPSIIPGISDGDNTPNFIYLTAISSEGAEGEAGEGYTEHSPGGTLDHGPLQFSRRAV
jgi:hypothetical protein